MIRSSPGFEGLNAHSQMRLGLSWRRLPRRSCLLRSPSVSQAHLRHKDSRTHERYKDKAGLRIIDNGAAVDAMPTMPQLEVAEATGTGPDAVVLPVVPKNRETSGNGGNHKSTDLGRTDVSLSNAENYTNNRHNPDNQKTGGGGNRTRVPKHFRNGLYVHSRSFNLNRPGV